MLGTRKKSLGPVVRNNLFGELDSSSSQQAVCKRKRPTYLAVHVLHAKERSDRETATNKLSISRLRARPAVKTANGRPQVSRIRRLSLFVMEAYIRLSRWRRFLEDILWLLQ